MNSARNPRSSLSGSRGFALAAVLAFLVLIGVLLSVMDLFWTVTGRRTRIATEREISRQNARAALQMALNALAAVPTEGRFVTSAAANVCASHGRCSHWTGLWSVADGRAIFSRWLVSGESTLVEDFSSPSSWIGPSAAPLGELGLPDRCPLEPVLANGKVQGHWAFWIGDEAAKVRINLPPPERKEPRVAQEFGDRWLLEQGAIAEQHTNLQTFSDLRAFLPQLNPEHFHDITFTSRGVLQTTAGQWPMDLNGKLLPGNFQPTEFLFSAREDLPQPPPTFGLLASYLAAVKEMGTDGALPFRSSGPLYRQLYGPQGCSHKLDDLPALSHGHALPTAYGIHPILCGAWLTISARVVGGTVLVISLRPQFAIWNPLAAPIALHNYGFCWRTAECGERWNPELSAKPALNLKIGAKNWAKIPLGDSRTGCLCRGTFAAALNPGQILLLSPDREQVATAGNALEGTFSPMGGGRWEIQWGLAEESGEILLGRLADLINRARWDGQTIQLTDGDGTILQEVADFVDEDGPNPLPHRSIPRDGHDHPIFQLRTHLRADTGPSPRWLVDHNPRAPQIRRSAFEHGHVFSLRRSDQFFRSYPSWDTEFREFSEDSSPPAANLDFLGKNGQPILFDVPREFFSIACLQHINLFPFSYHPTYAVGNSWAPYLLPRGESWTVADFSEHEYIRGEMRLDGSYLANRALFDSYFIGGFEDGSTHTHCRPWAPTDGTAARQNSSQLLANWGAFNVNGASVGAWKILLRSLPFDSATETYALPRYRGQKDQEGSPWGLCRLTADELDRLAECIAAEIRSDGPFASLAQFVNRRLGPASNPVTGCGPLQRAIEAAELRKFPPLPADDSLGERASGRPAAAGDANALCPCDLSQADLLQLFGNGLTVRGDTFLVRAYGDGSDGSESNPIFALLEGLVQRYPDGTWRLEELRWIH